MSATLEQAETTRFVKLHSTEGGSDKIYEMTLAPAADQSGWQVAYRNGPRGGTMAGGINSKTKDPLPYAKALAAFNSKLKEQTGKGYRVIESSEPGSGAQISAFQQRDSGMRPQLSNEIGPDQLEAYINDPAWIMQEKADGERRMIKIVNGVVTGVNRKGLTVELPDPVRRAYEAIVAENEEARNMEVDGELVGDVHRPFDVLSYNGSDYRSCETSTRLCLLHNEFIRILEALPSCATPISPLGGTDNPRTKRSLLSILRSNDKEGVVFKRADAPYESGRPNSGGASLKFRFHATLSAVVTAKNDKASVQIALVNPDGSDLPIGSVTVPANKRAEPGDIVEVRYLYAFRGGSLHQPVLLGRRNDLDRSDCVAEQRKFKPEVAETALEADDGPTP